MEDEKTNMVNESIDIVSEPTVDTANLESFERTSEYEILESKALKTLARRAMQQYQNGECISLEQAMQHFKRLVI
jgi:hypothetical protein